MGLELDRLRLVETMEQFNQRLGNVLLAGQEYRILELKKGDKTQQIEALKSSIQDQEQREGYQEKAQQWTKEIKQLRRKIEHLEKQYNNIEKPKQLIGQEREAYLKSRHDIREEIKVTKARIEKRKERLQALRQQYGIAFLEDKIIQKQNRIVELSEQQGTLGVQVSDLSIVRGEYSGPGAYFVQVDKRTTRLVKVNSQEDFMDQYDIDLNIVKTYKQVPDDIFNGWQSAIDASTTLQLSLGELFALAETNNTLILSKHTELEAFAKGYGHISASLAGIFAEIGGNAKVGVTIGKGSPVEYNPNLYAKGKGGVFVSPFGISAYSEAEAGGEHALSIKPEVKDGLFGVQSIDIKLKSYGKAEAKAAIGLTGSDGAEAKALSGGAKAAIAIGIAVGLGISFQYDDKEVGGLELEGAFELELGAGAFTKIDVKLGNLDDEGDEPMRICEVSVEIEICAAVGASAVLKGKLSIADRLYTSLKKKIKGALKEAIEGVLSEAVAAELLKIKEELDAYIIKVDDVLARIKNNSINAIRKGWANVQFDHDEKVRQKMKIHSDKLERYKHEVEDTIAKLEKLDYDQQDIEAFLKSIQYPHIIKYIKEYEGYSSKKKKALIQRLRNRVEAYDRRIEKFNNYLNNEFYLYIDNTEKEYHKALAIVEEFNQLLQQKAPTEKERSETRKAINKSYEKLNQIILNYNEVINSKDQLLSSENLHGDDHELPGSDTTEVKEAIELRYDYIKYHLDDLSSQVDDLRDVLK